MINSHCFLKIFKASSFPSLILLPDTPHFTIAEVNTAYLNATQTKETCLIGKSLFETFTGNIQQEHLRESLLKVISKKVADKISPKKFSIPISGTNKLIEKIWGFESIPVPGENDEIECIILNALDLTEKENIAPVFLEEAIRNIDHEKQPTLSLEESNQRYHYVSKATSDAIWDWDFLSNNIYWGEGFNSIFGYELENIKHTATSWKVLIHPEDYDRVLDGLSKAINGTQLKWEAEYRFLKADQTFAHVSDKGFFIRDKNDKTIRMVGAMQDISQRKKEEQHLKLLESVITHTTDAVLITQAEPIGEPGPCIIYVNEAFTNMTGYTAEEVISKTPRILQGIKTDRTELDRLRKSLEKWQPCEITTINYKKNGEEFWVNISVSPVANDKGWFTHWIAIQKDVTQQKTEELQKAFMAEISLLFNGPGSLQLILQQMLEKLLDYGDFSLGEIWLIGSDQKNINLIAKAFQADEFEEFYNENKEVKSFTKGKGLPGITWESRKVQVWDKAHQTQNFTRQIAVEKYNIQKVYSLPLIYDDELIGVLILGSGNPKKYLNRLEALFESFGPLLTSRVKQKKLEEELNQVFSLAPDIICIQGIDGYFKKVNPAACKLFEYSEKELLSSPIAGFIHPEDREASTIEIQEVAKGKSTSYFENRYITKGGQVKWLAWTSTPSPEEGLVFAIAKDITEKKSLQVLLDKTNKLARIGSWEIDVLKGTVYWSDITKEIRETEPDYEPELALGMNGFKEGKDRTTIFKRLDECIKNGTPWDEELQIVTQKGNLKWIRTIGEPEIVNGKCVKIYGSFQDIDEKKKAELELRQFKKIIENSKDGIGIIDNTGHNIYLNPAFAKVFGISSSETLNSYHPAKVYTDQNLAREVFGTLLSGRYWQGDIEVKNSEGKILNFYLSSGPIFDDEGNLIAAYGIHTDISERKKAAKELHDAFVERNNILESIGDAFYTVDKNWIVTYWNKEAEKILGRPKEEILGKNLWEQYPDVIGTSFHDYYHNSVQTNSVQHFEAYYETLKIWFEVSAYPSGDGLSVYFRDVTERKHAIEKIKLSNERFEHVSRATNDAIWDLDLVSNTLHLGEGFRKLWGDNFEKEMHGLDSWLNHIHPEDRPIIDKRLKDALTNKEIFSLEGEYRYERSDNSYVYVMARGSIIRNEEGKAIRLVGACTDMTYRKEYEASLKNLNADLEKINKELVSSNLELERFAYIASHDLQEPLRMVTGFLSQLEKKYGEIIDDKGKQYIHFAVDGAKRMRQIISDLLEFSRIGRKQNHKTEEINLHELLNEAISLYQNQIEESHAKIELKNLVPIQTSRGLLSQVFQNLLGNALKYHKKETPPEIIISLEDAETHWQFEVCDNGIGIEPKYFDRIFIIFQRLHNKDEYSGTGIGLAIVKKIVENLGGEIWVKSEVGKGSSFYFTVKK